MTVLRKVFAVATLGVAAAVGFALTSGHGNSMEATATGFQLTVDEKGQIRVPDVDYRRHWVAIGTWAVAADEGTPGSKGFHTVYTQPEVVDQFRKSGKFPDGAVLIKELFSTETADMTTGTVSRAAKTTGWFVMVKDANNRYPGNPLWGDGWGWAYFDAANPKTTTTSDYLTECKGCHIPAEKTDWIYTDGYPALNGG